MAATYLIDSNVIIDYIGRKFSSSSEVRLDTIFNSEFNYSIITFIEVLGYDRLSVSEYQSFSAFLQTGVLYDVNLNTAEKAISMRRLQTKKILPDLLIAATAVVNGFTLLTNNSKDFKNIPDLKVENPWDWY